MPILSKKCDIRKVMQLAYYTDLQRGGGGKNSGKDLAIKVVRTLAMPLRVVIRDYIQMALSV